MRKLHYIAPAVALLAALASCGGDTAPKTGAQDAAKRPQTSRTQPRASHTAGSAALPTLRLDEVTESSAGPDAADRPARNLFAFEEDPAVVAERERQAEEARKAQAAAAEQARKDQAAREETLRVHPPPPQPPPIPFTFIGYFGPPQARIGVFSMGGGQEMILARQGDRIQQKFFVKEVGFESAEIGFEGFTETRRITLTPGS